MSEWAGSCNVSEGICLLIGRSRRPTVFVSSDSQALFFFPFFDDIQTSCVTYYRRRPIASEMYDTV